MTAVGVAAPAGASADEVNGTRRLPARIGVLPLRDTVTFPELVIPLNVGQPRSIELVNDVLRGDRSIVLVAGRDPEVEAPGPDELYSVGVLGTVARMVRVPDGTLRVLIQGGQRVRVAGVGPDRALSGRRGRRGARRGQAERRSWTRSRATCSRRSPASSARSPTCPRSCR